MNDEKFLGLSIWSPWWPRIIVGLQLVAAVLWVGVFVYELNR